jgi:hypothetical protein
MFDFATVIYYDMFFTKPCVLGIKCTLLPKV